MSDGSGFEFETLRAALQALAAPAPVQLARYPEFVVKADELALDFDDALLLVRHNRAAEIDARQAAALAALDELFTRMRVPRGQSCGRRRRCARGRNGRRPESSRPRHWWRSGGRSSPRRRTRTSTFQAAAS